MKKLVIIAITFLMTAPAVAFDQADLDNIGSFEEIVDNPNFDFEGFSNDGVDNVENFLGKRKFRCVAENRRGRRFVAKAKVRRRARRRALRKCRNNSKRPGTCYIVRCKRKGGKFGEFIDIIDGIGGLF